MILFSGFKENQCSLNPFKLIKQEIENFDRGQIFMVTKQKGRRMIEEIVERYRFVENNPELINKRLLSEQDITTKFVLPMLAALNWNVCKIGEKGPEVHEKAFREKIDVNKGLPDIILKSKNGMVFVEVKRPPLGERKIANLERYRDADIIALTSFEDLKVYTRYKKNKPKLRFECDFESYIGEFDQLWHILSNTDEGKRARAAYKATRNSCTST